MIYVKLVLNLVQPYLGMWLKTPEVFRNFYMQGPRKSYVIVLEGAGFPTMTTRYGRVDDLSTLKHRVSEPTKFSTRVRYVRMASNNPEANLPVSCFLIMFPKRIYH